MPRNLNRHRPPYGQFILDLRTQKGLSQEALAETISKRLGRKFRPATVSFFETTGDISNRDLIPAYADALGVSVETFLGLKHSTPANRRQVKLQITMKRKPAENSSKQ